MTSRPRTPANCSAPTPRSVFQATMPISFRPRAALRPGVRPLLLPQAPTARSLRERVEQWQLLLKIETV